MIWHTITTDDAPELQCSHLVTRFTLKRLHPVFNVVKLTAAPMDPIPGRHRPQPPPPELVNGEEEYIVEDIIDSRMFRRQLQYLVKWEGYGLEYNTWEDSGNVANA